MLISFMMLNVSVDVISSVDSLMVVNSVCMKLLFVMFRLVRMLVLWLFCMVWFSMSSMVGLGIRNRFRMMVVKVVSVVRLNMVVLVGLCSGGGLVYCIWFGVWV